MANKINFDLTPKETMEILNVLRQTAPVPPLRICQDEINTKRHSNVLERKKDDSLLELNKQNSKHKRNQTGKRLELNTRAWRNARREPSSDSSSSPSPVSPNASDIGEAEDLWGSVQSNRPSFTANMQCSLNNPSACLRAENCDIFSYKEMINTNEPYRTKGNSSFSDSENESIDMEKLIVDKDEEDELSSSLSDSEDKSEIGLLCVEARKVTHKMNIYTVKSEPAKKTVETVKQISQKLVK